MPASATKSSYFPQPRAELAEKLVEADQILDASMAGSEQTIPAGYVLVREGESHQSVYRLVRGKMVRVRSLEDGRRQIICIFTPGDLLAVKSMMLDRQPDNIEALSRAAVMSLEVSKGLSLAGEHPNVALRLMWQLAEDERRLHNSVTLLGRGTALERISTVLLDLQARLLLFDGGRSPIAIRQQDLADYVGLTLVHVNRTLRSLREQGALATEHGGIVLRDITALHRYAKPMLDIFERETAEFGGNPETLRSRREDGVGRLDG
jgi:CRP/FNR family transcriptional regulator